MSVVQTGHRPGVWVQSGDEQRAHVEFQREASRLFRQAEKGKTEDLASEKSHSSEVDRG